jgi:site-specific recombinase XerD
LQTLANKTVIKRSLKTKDSREARRRAPAVIAHIDSEIARLRRSLHLGSSDLDAVTGEYFNQRLKEIIRKAQKEQWDNLGFEMPPDLLLEDIEPSATARLSTEDWTQERRRRANDWGLQAIQPILDKHGLALTPANADRLGQEVFRAELKAYLGAQAEVLGSRTWTPPTYANKSLESSHSLIELWEGYEKSRRNAGTAPRTLDGWRSNIKKASDFFSHQPSSSLKRKDIWAYAEALRSPDKGVSPAGKRLAAKTVNDGHIAALSALYKWAISLDLLENDPTKGVRVTASASDSTQIRGYTREEVTVLLQAAREPRSKRTSRDHANISRWVPWLCAFTGARISEVLWLRQSDVSKTEGITYIDIQIDKSEEGRSVKTSESMRSVPLHPAILDEGFLEYLASLSKGEKYLFPGPWTDQHGDRTKTPANRLRDWIHKQLPEADWSRLSPNHSFRHWLTSECRRASIDGDHQRIITGHKASDIHGRYGPADVLTLYEEIIKIPSPLATVDSQLGVKA